MPLAFALLSLGETPSSHALLGCVFLITGPPPRTPRPSWGELEQRARSHERKAFPWRISAHRLAETVESMRNELRVALSPFRTPGMARSLGDVQKALAEAGAGAIIDRWMSCES